MRMDTKASLQNVLSTERITDPIIAEVNTIKPTLLSNIVGTAWDNKVLWTIPARMSDANNEIIVADTREMGLTLGRSGTCRASGLEWYLHN